MPTLDGLIFAIDAHETDSVHNELQVLLQSLDYIGSVMPVLILCCITAESADSSEKLRFHEKSSDMDLRLHAQDLDLINIKRSWGVFKINISTMEGMDLALTWILYHNQKQREELRFHKKSAHNKI